MRALAIHLRTAAPDHIIAGIDANFFVTEVPMSVNGRALTGRTLYVSLPLLRVLDKAEADAVMVHELAHLKGGDTFAGAAVAPKLLQFDAYCEAMRGSGLTVVAFFLLSLYRFIFELALMRASREREFKADRTAAETIGALPLIRALIKVAAYSIYRGRVEHELFGREKAHDASIGIAAFVADGLRPFAQSSEFLSAMETASTPHPFDSHPLLAERMRNVGSLIAPDDFGAVVASTGSDDWSQRVITAFAIEQRLWSSYEERFAQMHEHDLAYRYMPEGAEQQAIVEKYFPLHDFPLKEGKNLVVSFEGLRLPGDAGFVAWNQVADLEYEDGYGSDVLKITTKEKGVFEDKAAKFKLPGIEDQRAHLKSALGNYWHRHKVAREYLRADGAIA